MGKAPDRCIWGKRPIAPPIWLYAPETIGNHRLMDRNQDQCKESRAIMNHGCLVCAMAFCPSVIAEVQTRFSVKSGRNLVVEHMQVVFVRIHYAFPESLGHRV